MNYYASQVLHFQKCEITVSSCTAVRKSKMSCFGSKANVPFFLLLACAYEVKSSYKLACRCCMHQYCLPQPQQCQRSCCIPSTHAQIPQTDRPTATSHRFHQRLAHVSTCTQMCQWSHGNHQLPHFQPTVLTDHYHCEQKWGNRASIKDVDSRSSEFWPWSLWSLGLASWCLCCSGILVETTEAHSGLNTVIATN